MKGLVCVWLFLLASSLISVAENDQDQGHRLVILVEIGNEHDEMQQMAHMLLNSNEFDLQALIAVTGKWLHPGMKNPYRQKLHPELFHELIDGYEKVLPNLKKHASGWPEADYLRSIVYEGQTGYGVADTGSGKSSAGSKAIADCLKSEDERPLWVVVNAGSNTLAQALLDLEAEVNEERFGQLIKKLRVFENGAKDNAVAWICARYPAIHWIRSNYQTYSYGGPRGKDMGPHTWKPYAYSPKGQHEWLKEHVQVGHGALGELYPDRIFGNKRYGFIEGGGTIPWLGLVNRGLFSINEPSWGGWSGRFSREKVANVWSRHDSVNVDEKKGGEFRVYTEVADAWVNPDGGETLEGNSVPVWRWRKAMYANLQCRMDWCVKSFEEANHHPVAALNGSLRKRILWMPVSPDERIEFDASASRDPDGDELEYRWWIYQEAGTYSGELKVEGAQTERAVLVVPEDASGKQIHLISEVRDYSIPSLYDYRRVVIDVL